MRFWAFDSFKGLPRLEGVDIGGEFHEGQFSCEKDQFFKNLSDAGVDLDRVVVIDGWFNETLTSELKHKRGLSVAAIVYIDADLYVSTVPILAFLTDILATGSIVMFDDWFCFRGHPEKGVQRAWREWLDLNPHYEAHDWHLFGAYGKSFMMVRRLD